MLLSVDSTRTLEEPPAFLEILFIEAHKLWDRCTDMTETISEGEKDYSVAKNKIVPKK
jgi:cytochrome oxidase Cu insertion factor (SCO1/SenC/PrrC family)